MNEITFQIEDMNSIKDEIMHSLANDHSEEFTYDLQDKGKPDPNWELGEFLSTQKKLFICTARDAGKLIGYFVFFTTPLAHYKTVMCAYEDTFYLKPEYRKALLGYSFLKFCVEEMKKTGAKVLRVANKEKTDYECLWNRLGFKREEIVYTQVIK